MGCGEEFVPLRQNSCFCSIDGRLDRAVRGSIFPSVLFIVANVLAFINSFFSVIRGYLARFALVYDAFISARLTGLQHSTA